MATGSFSEAVADWQRRRILPTSLSSAELKQIGAGIRRQSVFSARTTIEGYLDEVKDVVDSVIDPKQVQRDGEDQTVTEGFNPATAREALRNKLRELDYQPEDGEEGTIKDLSSDSRLDLVVETNTELAQGAGKFVQANANEDVVDLWPAWQLVRYEDREEPRDWEQRWRIACQVAGDPQAAAALDLHGKMAALKSSGVWQALGDGAGGYDDTLSNPFPPFAFRSGMWTEDVSREEAEGLGLLQPGEKAEGADVGGVLGVLGTE